MYSHTTAEPFRAALAVAGGEVTRARLRGAEFVSLYRGVYIGASATVDALVRARALALRAGPGSVIAGPLAALVLDTDCPWQGPEVVVPGNRRFQHDEATMHRWHLDRWEVVEQDGIAVTSPARTAFDLARRDAPFADRLAAVDALAHRHGFGLPALQEVAGAHPGVRGSVAARELFALVDPRAESLMESRMRLVVARSDLPTPVPQLAVVLPNGKRIRLDLAWPDARVALGYDGEEHRTPARHADDLERDAGLQELGWRIVRVTARQVYRAPLDLVRRVGLLLGC